MSGAREKRRVGIERVAAFIGRSYELETLNKARLDSHRRGGFAIVAGEAGVGKSRLLREFLRTVPRGRAAIGVGAAMEHIRSPFEPWIAPLQAVAPEAAAILIPQDDRRDGQAAMYRAVVDRVREAANHRSLIVAIEDLQWADTGSLDLLHLLIATHPPIQRLFVIATVRLSEITGRLRDIVSHADVSVVELSPLPRQETVSLVRSVLPQPEASRAERIAELSGGNPFFAIELAGAPSRGGIPLTLRAAIDARLAQLNEADLPVLEGAAVLGERFNLAALSALFSAAPPEIAARLHDAERLRIVVGGNDGAFRFSHALTRAVLLDRLTTAQRLHLHSAAARALEREGRYDAVGFAELAYHYAGAHDRAKAYAYSMRAGGLAYSVHAYADATRFFAEAANNADAGSLERARALARQGDALFRVPELDAAEAAYVEAIAIYRSAGANEDAARLYQSLATSLFNQNRMRDALGLIDRAFTDLSPLPVEIADELALQGAMHALEIDPELGTRWLARVDEERIRNTGAGGKYYSLCATVKATQGDADGFKELLAAFESHLESVSIDAHYVAYFGNLAANALFLGLPAMSLYERCFAAARSVKMDVYEAAFASHAAYERWLHGDDDGFTRFATLAAQRDAPIPALHAYVLLAGILGAGTLPASAEVESLIAGGHNEFYAPLAGIFARRAIEGGNARTGRHILERAAERLIDPYAAFELITAMAEFGSEAARGKAERLMSPHLDSTSPAFAATAAMVRALACARDGDIESRDRFAAKAAQWYGRCGWVHHERRAREIGMTATNGPALSERERQVAQLLRGGSSNRAIAATLFISEKTVEKHLARLYEKLKVNNRAAAVQALAEHLQG